MKEQRGRSPDPCKSGRMDASLPDVLSGLRVVSLPLATRFRGLTIRETAVFEGPMGWTEFSPFVEYDDIEAARWLAAAYDFGWTATPPGVREKILVNATVPAVSALRVPEILDRFSGCRTVKVKVAEPGTTLADDVARVAEVRRILGAEGRIRIDANGAWNVDEAEHAIRELAVHDLEYAEQPCAELVELQELEDRIGYLDVPIAVDEGLRKAVDPLVAAPSAAGSDRHREGSAARRHPLGARDSRSEWASRCGLECPRVVHRPLDGPAPGRGAARARLRLRPGHRRPAGR